MREIMDVPLPLAASRLLMSFLTFQISICRRHCQLGFVRFKHGVVVGIVRTSRVEHASRGRAAAHAEGAQFFSREWEHSRCAQPRSTGRTLWRKFFVEKTAGKIVGSCRKANSGIVERPEAVVGRIERGGAVLLTR